MNSKKYRHLLIKTGLLMVGLCMINTVIKAQDQKPILATYMEEVPVIDGRLDAHLSDIPRNEFPFFTEFDNPATEKVGVTYAFAYNEEYLYVYIETDADTIHYHKRGYLWGDGYKLLIGMPSGSESTKEYYELSYSPTRLKEDEWDRQRIAAYNGSQRTPALSSRSKTSESAYDGRSGFESLIAWEDIEPYHPAFMNEMGFGLYFAKGKWSEDIGYFANGYSMVYDPGIFAEEIVDRAYHLLHFDRPVAAHNKPVLQLTKRHVIPEETLSIEVSAFSSPGPLQTDVFVMNEEGDTVFTTQTMLTGREETRTISLPIPELEFGEHTISFNQEDRSYSEQFGVIPNLSVSTIRERLTANTAALDLGVIHTLMFKLQQIETALNTMHWYETGKSVLDLWPAFKEELDLFDQGEHPYAGRVTPYRRAFLSKQDSTLQPYSIKLPATYNAAKKYPLLVFLHGSGQDDRGLLNSSRSNGAFIEIAPFARDKYFAYANSYSQIDILEAIEDVSQHFSVDTNTVVIGGFSMGGYGALRTFFEHPEKYKGVAVFAGHPNLANMWLDDGGHPDFTQEAFAAVFKEKPVFVYHGLKDPALDVESAKQLIQTLQQAGARVTQRLIPERGHVYQDEETNQMYHNWLKEITTQSGSQ